MNRTVLPRAWLARIGVVAPCMALLAGWAPAAHAAITALSAPDEVGPNEVWNAGPLQITTQYSFQSGSNASSWAPYYRPDGAYYHELEHMQAYSSLAWSTTALTEGAVLDGSVAFSGAPFYGLGIGAYTWEEDQWNMTSGAVYDSVNYLASGLYGFRWADGSGTHYGWLDISTAYTHGSSGGLRISVNRMAWDDSAHSIVVGAVSSAVPEPATGLLWLCAGGWLAARRWRQRPAR